jgi:appr-1-p processing enzyme family protein
MLKLIKNENIFNSKCEYIVNPVNTVGIMGKGLALQFKEKYPENFEKYKKYCQKGDFTVGKLLIINEKNKKIINFPTKIHWKNKSKLQYITDGLAKLKIAIEKRKINSIAMPKIGCGLGGLDWDLVFLEICKFYNELSSEISESLIIEIYL